MKKSYLLAIACVTLIASQAQAQLGSGWQSYSPRSYVQVGGDWGSGGKYTNSGGVETFEMTKSTDKRVERRFYDDYTSGKRQFQGEFYIVRFDGTDPEDDVCIMQVWKTMMLSYSGYKNGSLRQHSDYFVNNLKGRWVKVNVFHDASKNYGEVWVDGRQEWSGPTDDTGSTAYYHKYGIYNQAVNHPTVKWKNIKFFKDGNIP